MKLGHQNALVLCCLLLGWFADAALLHQGALSRKAKEQTQEGAAASHSLKGDSHDDDDSQDDDDGEGDSDDDESSPSSSGTERQNDAAAFPQLEKAPVAAAAPAAPVGVTVGAAPAPAALASKPCDAETNKTKKELCKLEEDLAENQAEQKKLSASLKHLSNETEADKEIEVQANQVANETESKALGSTLANMWKEMRMFDMPSYTKHIRHKLHHLKHDEIKLQEKIAVAKGERAPAQKDKAEKEGSDDDEKKDEDDKDDKDATQKIMEAEVVPPIDTGNADTDKVAKKTWKMLFFADVVGTLVYILLALLCAVLYDRARKMYPEHFKAPARSDLQKTSGFSFSLFGCLEAPNICLLGWCCPLMTWAHTLDTRGLWKFFQAFLAMLILLVLNSYTFGISSIFAIGLGVYYRQKLRKSYTLESGGSTVCADCLVWTFFAPCAICQEAREESVVADLGEAP